MRFETASSGRLLSCALLVIALAGCESASLSFQESVGASPTLPEPKQSLIPTVNIAPAKGWTGGEMPTAAEGLQVDAFARGLDHPRWLYTLPNGDVLVAESNAPPKTEAKKSIRGWFMKVVMKRAGAGVPSADRITLLRDADGDGVAEVREVFLENLFSPFGMALVGEELFVANADAIMRFPYREGATQIRGKGSKLTDLPGGPINHHWTKNIIASKDGTKLYATVGSNSNIGENGMDNETDRAAILEVDIATGEKRVFASGLRNPNGLAWIEDTLWTVVNERDELGSDLVPDYLTSVQEDGFYGWPYSYYGQNIDKRVEQAEPALVERAIVPDYALGSHVAPLGLVFYQGELLPSKYSNGAFIGQHGSWNRRPLSGYNVVFVPFSGGKPAGKPQNILTDFVDDDNEAKGRPVGVAVDAKGALLVADDVGNVIWRVTPSGS